MQNIRKANATDSKAIFDLYKSVTSLPHGLARQHHEITQQYIDDILQKALTDGEAFIIEHPSDANVVIAEIHCYKPGIEIFNHVLGDLTIAVDPAFQNQKLGKLLFFYLLDYIKKNRKDILRVELITEETHSKAIRLYESIGFVKEGRFEKKFRKPDGSFAADLPMAWFNEAFEGNS